MRGFTKPQDDRLLVGLESSDDAAVYKINDEVAVIQTLDFFTPIVDDPYTFGMIAAANSLSDVYAMGGKPVLALNIVCFPDCLPPDVLREILRGGEDKVREAGCLLVGGHSVSDDEPKYGLSVMGIVHPDRVRPNNRAEVGDVLILTKPLGVGIINTALKAELADQKAIDEAVHSMSSLNRLGQSACEDVDGVHAITDITGFGLAGHTIEVAEGSDKTVIIDSGALPYIEAAKAYAGMGLVPAGAYKNREHYMGRMEIADSVEEYMRDIIFDPQTSGGLLISVKAEEADRVLKGLEASTLPYGIIGRVVEKREKFLYVE